MKSKEELAYNKTSEHLSSIFGQKPKKEVRPFSDYTPTPEKEFVFETPESIAAKLNAMPGALGSHVIKDALTPEKVIEHIKNLKGNDRLDISNIRNGEQLSRIAQRQDVNMNDMRWHGSGSGGGSTTNFAENEVVAGSNTTFTLTNSPIAGSVKVYALGQRLTLTTDYTIVGKVITTISTWSAGQILADYRY